MHCFDYLIISTVAAKNTCTFPYFLLEHLFIRFNISFSASNFCCHVKILLNNLKFNVLEPNYLVCKCYDKYNGEQISFVTTVF